MPPNPKRAIRRFDVFAEYRKQEQVERGRPVDEAKGYGLWVAKVVAARRFGRAGDLSPHDRAGRDEPERPEREGGWHALGGEPQTAALFDREIVERMGEAFYQEVFVPAIREARQQGHSYEMIRDRIR